MPEEPEIQQETWTYLGRAVSDKKTLDFHWFTPHGYKLFSKFHPPGARPGTTWTIHCSVTADGGLTAFSAGANAPVFEGIVDDDQKASLELASAAAVTTARVWKKTKTDMEEVTLAAICLPLRDAYRHQKGVGKAALLARVIQEMQK